MSLKGHRARAGLIVVLLVAMSCGLSACGGDKAPRESGSPVADDATPADDLGSNTARGVAEQPVVYLAGLEDFPQSTLERLRAFFQEEHGIAIGILPAVRVDESAFDPERQQLVADRLLESIDRARGAEPGDRVVIGLTQYDIMMLDRPDWAFVFSLRDESLGVAVVSVARMDPRSFGERRDDDLLFERAAKMVGKNIGVMYLGLPMSEDPRSVMYNQLFSLYALDAVDDDFRLSASP